MSVGSHEFYENIRATDTSSSEVTYLDHGGAAIPLKSQLDDAFSALQSSLFGNPHSKGAVGESTEEMIDSVRLQVLSHFNVGVDDYDCIFTSGTTASMKLIGECFPWGDQGSLCYQMNSHTSLLGLRTYAPHASCIPSITFRQSKCGSVNRLSGKHQNSVVDKDTVVKSVLPSFNLLVLPGECNFSGGKIDLSLPGQVLRDLDEQGGGVAYQSWLDSVGGQWSSVTDHASIVVPGQNWCWMLDAAKLAATTDIRLDLLAPIDRPHFVVASFYKIFGYPSGIGVLLVRKDEEYKAGGGSPTGYLLNKRYFGGGAVASVAADVPFSVPKAAYTSVTDKNKDTASESSIITSSPVFDLHHSFEDGTINYHGILALRSGFRSVRNTLGGMKCISSYLFDLSQYLYHKMTSLVHDSTGDSTGDPLCIIYGHHHEHNILKQGPTITFNMKWATGDWIGSSEVGKLATEHNFQIRTGACQEQLQWSGEDVQSNYKIGRSCWDDSVDIINGKPTGAVRVSLGYHNIQEDCDKWVLFLQSHYLNHAPPILGMPNVLATHESENSSCVSSSVSVGTEQQDDQDTCVLTGPDNGRSVPTFVPLRIDQIYIYPIKSCAGIRVKRWPIMLAGKDSCFYLDRYWALVCNRTGHALTQKSYPKMNLLQPSLDEACKLLTISVVAAEVVPSTYEPRSVTIAISTDTNTSQSDTLSAGESVKAPERSNERSKLHIREVRICGKKCQGFTNTSDEVNEWFSDYLGISCSLVRSSNTPISSNSADDQTKMLVESRKSFANEAQFLVISGESVDALSQVMHQTVAQQQALLSSHTGRTSLPPPVSSAISVATFRPNLVVLGGTREPHQEDTWSYLHIPIPYLSSTNVPHRNSAEAAGHVRVGDLAQKSRQQYDAGAGSDPSLPSNPNPILTQPPSLSLKVLGPCARCSMVNVSPSLGVINGDVLQTLGTYRKQGSKIFFGQFCSFDTSTVPDAQRGGVSYMVEEGVQVEASRVVEK